MTSNLSLVFLWDCKNLCFYKISPDEDDVNHIWLPKLYGMSFLAPSRRVGDVPVHILFLSCKTPYLMKRVVLPFRDTEILSLSNFSRLLCLWDLNNLLYLFSLSTKMPNLSSFLSSAPTLPPPPSRWKRRDLGQSVPREIVFLKSNQPFHDLPGNASTFSTTLLQGTNRLSLICRRRSSYSNHYCFSRKALFRLLNPLTLPYSIYWGCPAIPKLFTVCSDSQHWIQNFNFCAFRAPLRHLFWYYYFLKFFLLST